MERMAFGEMFAQASVKGALTRAAVAWVLITPAITMAKIWWSGAAALVVFLVGVTVYIVAATLYRRRRSLPPAA
jgi:hypothetical protein